MLVVVYTSLFIEYKNKNTCIDFDFWARSQNSEKRLLASSCLSAWNNSAPTGRILTRKFTFEYFSKICVEKIRVSLKHDKNNGYFAPIPLYFHVNISQNSS